MVDPIRLGLTSGFVSVAFWVVVYTPQIAETIALQSGEGLSVAFLLIWLTGDITGLIGAVIQKLTPTISLLAIYYTFCDVVLLSLIYYYRKQRALYPERFVKDSQHSSSERSPLLGSQKQDDIEGQTTFSKKAVRFVSRHRYAILAYLAATVFIVGTGLVSWFTSAKQAHTPRADEEWSTTGQVVGWLSAFLYLGSRIPQIMKNMQTKCQGLSLMMFCLSVLGNLTYCGAILFPNTSPQHVWLNMSWLVGSAGTILLDFIVLGQFVYYSKERHEKVFIVGGESHISGI